MLCRKVMKMMWYCDNTLYHTQTKSWSCSEEGLYLQGDKLRWQPCQSLFFPPTLQKIQFTASTAIRDTGLHSARGGFWYRSSTQNSDLAFGILPNLSHAQVWSWSDCFVSLKCLSAPESAGRWVKSFPRNAHFHLKPVNSTWSFKVVFVSGVKHSLTPETIKINQATDEMLPVSSKHCSWLPRKWCFVSKGQSGTEVWEWWCLVSPRELQLWMKLHHHLLDTLGMELGSSVFCYEQNDNNSLKIKLANLLMQNP